MLEFKDVHFAYPGARRQALSGVSLSVAPGERVTLLGANGSGKSTMASLANASLLPSEGSVIVDGLRSADADQRDIAQLVGIVRQDPLGQLVGLSVEDEVAFGPRSLMLPAGRVERRVAAALDACGLSALRLREARTLSGGQLQLLAFASVLAMEPRYLVLDEADAHLDASSRNAVRSLVERLRAQGVGILQIAQHLEDADEASRAYAIEDGRLAWQGHARELPSAHRRRARPVSLPEPAGEGLRLDGATVILGGRKVISNLSIQVRHGEVVLLRGPSGCGKTTAAGVLAGALKPDEGSATLDGRPVRPGMVGLAFQRVEDQLFADTVWEDVAYGPRNLGLPEEEVGRRSSKALSVVGVPPELYACAPHVLSGGLRRRAALAGVLALEAGAYVLDEPTAGLDQAGRELLGQVLAGLARRGAAVLVITHDALDGPDGPSRPRWEGMPVRVVTMDAPLAQDRSVMREGPLYGLAPQVKVAGLLMLAAAVFAARSWRGVALAGVVATLCLARGRVRPRDVARALGATAVVLTFALIANSLRIDGSADLALVGALGISYGGALRGALAALRIVIAVCLVSFVGATTSVPDLVESVASVLRPLGRLGLPASDVSLAVSLALRSMPETAVELGRIKAAQEVRGARFSDGPPLRRVGAWKAVLVPLVVALMGRADDLARSLRDRCYAGSLTPTSRRLGAGAWGMLALVALIAAAVWLA